MISEKELVEAQLKIILDPTSVKHVISDPGGSGSASTTLILLTA
jgi:hypothetical protein